METYNLKDDRAHETTIASTFHSHCS